MFQATNTNSRPAVLPNAPRRNHASDHKDELSTCGFTECSTPKSCLEPQDRTLDLRCYRTPHAKTVFRTTHEFPICGSTERSTQNPCFGFQTRTLDLFFYRTLHAKTVFRTTNTNSRFRFYRTLHAKTVFWVTNTNSRPAFLPNAPRENRGSRPRARFLDFAWQPIF